jgi:hypothetical protein
MAPSFDVFKIHSIGNVLWRDAIESRVGVSVSIETLATSSPGEYVIFDQKTGQKIFVTLPGVSAKRGSQAVFKSILNTGRGPHVLKGSRRPCGRQHIPSAFGASNTRHRNKKTSDSAGPKATQQFRFD